jgi:Gas vesicle protein
MTIKRIAPTLSTADVLDRVLDKGLVIDAEISIAVAGIELVTVSAFVRIASFATWDRYVAASERRELSLPRAATASERAGSRRATAVASADSDTHRVRLRCEEGCTFERRASTLVVRDGVITRQRCAVKPRRACAVSVV